MSDNKYDNKNIEDDDAPLYTPDEEKFLQELNRECKETNMSCVEYCRRYLERIPRHKPKDEQDIPEDAREVPASYGNLAKFISAPVDSDTKGDVMSLDCDSVQKKVFLRCERPSLDSKGQEYHETFELSIGQCTLSTLLMNAIEDELETKDECTIPVPKTVNPEVMRFIVDYLKERSGMLPVFGDKARQTKDWFEKPYADKYWFYREIRKKNTPEILKTVMRLEDFTDGTTQGELDKFFSKRQDWDMWYAFSVVFIANFFGISTLVDFCMSWIGYKFKGNTPGELRVMLNIDEKLAQRVYKLKKENKLDQLTEQEKKNPEVTALCNELYEILLDGDEQFTDYYKMWKTFEQEPGDVHANFNNVDLNNIPTLSS